MISFLPQALLRLNALKLGHSPCLLTNVFVADLPERKRGKRLGMKNSSMMFCSCAPTTNLSVFSEQLVVTKVAIVIFARIRRQLSSQARLNQFTLLYPVSLKSTLISSSRTNVCHSSSFLESRLQFLYIFLLYFRSSISYK
jgi:hypothetical protein